MAAVRMRTEPPQWRPRKRSRRNRFFRMMKRAAARLEMALWAH